MTAPPVERRAVARAVRVDPDCPGTRHAASDRAYRRHGCRCPAAVDAHREYLAREHARRARRRRGGTQAGQVRAARWELDEAARQRARWRGAKTRVSRVNLLLLLLSGFRDAPTQREMMLAVARLDALGLDAPEVAERLGTGGRQVLYYRGLFAEYRAGRTARRLADARWRAARNRWLALGGGRGE